MRIKFSTHRVFQPLSLLISMKIDNTNKTVINLPEVSRFIFRMKPAVFFDDHHYNEDLVWFTDYRLTYFTAFAPIFSGPLPSSKIFYKNMSFLNWLRRILFPWTCSNLRSVQFFTLIMFRTFIGSIYMKPILWNL